MWKTTMRGKAGLSLALTGAVGTLVLTSLLPAQASAPGHRTPSPAASPDAVGAKILAPRATYSPDFGPNVKIFGPKTPDATINAYLQSIAGEEQFSTGRHLVLFKPGTYGSAASPISSTVGYYTSIAGLGASPRDVVINGALHVDPEAGPFGPSALDHFWRSLANLTINPDQAGEAPHTMSWAVSQATPLRRVNITGNLDLTGPGGSLAFGSEIADSRIAGTVRSGNALAGEPAQAQYYTRNSVIGSWDGTGVNLVFSGVHGAPSSGFDPNGYTTLPSTPLSRPAPFLYLEHGKYQVFVPSAATHTVGVNWSTGHRAGQSLAIDRFFIAKPTDTAARINRALAAGKNLLLTPGGYDLEAPIQVTRPNTVVLGLGYATLMPTQGTAALLIRDVPGVAVSGLVVDAGAVPSETLVRVGRPGQHKGRSDADNPTTLADLFVRVGGATAGVADTGVTINSDHVLIDDSWIWRADHGTGGGWTTAQVDHGLIINGDDVTATGLFVEHWQKQQVVWNGQDGETVFYQSEMPEGMPNQAAWMNGTTEGYASYAVGTGVRTHRATGMSIYSLFPFPPTEAIHAAAAITSPTSPQVRLTSLAAGVVIGQGGIRHIINDTGDAADASAPNHVDGMTAVTRFLAYPAE